MSDQWYYRTGAGQQGGPISGAELKRLAAGGLLSPTDLLWNEGKNAWVSAASLRGLFDPQSAPVQAPAIPSTPGADDRYDDREDYVRSARRGAPSGAARATAAITATELGISSVMLGGINLVGQLYPLIGAMAASAASGGGGMAGATLMLVLFLLLSLFAGFLGVMGLVTAFRKGQAGGCYCVVGIIVSAVAFIASIMMLFAVSSAMGRHNF